MSSTDQKPERPADGAEETKPNDADGFDDATEMQYFEPRVPEWKQPAIIEGLMLSGDERERDRIECITRANHEMFGHVDRALATDDPEIAEFEFRGTCEWLVRVVQCIKNLMAYRYRARIKNVVHVSGPAVGRGAKIQALLRAAADSPEARLQERVDLAISALGAVVDHFAKQERFVKENILDKEYASYARLRGLPKATFELASHWGRLYRRAFDERSQLIEELTKIERLGLPQIVVDDDKPVATKPVAIASEADNAEPAAAVKLRRVS